MVRTLLRTRIKLFKSQLCERFELAQVMYKYIMIYSGAVNYYLACKNFDKNQKTNSYKQNNKNQEDPRKPNLS